MTNKKKKKVTSLTHILVTGAREHNLQNIDLAIPKNKLVVFSGLSGSGKSSLAFDTLYAEGQRRYVESLSSYARQFLGLMSKPDVDQIEGLSPAISIDQKTTSHNPRSTVGTITEIYDYLRLLFARIGHPHCPQCGQLIANQSIDQITQQIIENIENNSQQTPVKLMILSPVVRNRKGEFSDLFKTLQKKGYQRIRIDQEIHKLPTNITLIKTNKHNIDVVVERIVADKKIFKQKKTLNNLRSRLNQSIEQALKLSDGLVTASYIEDSSFNFPENPSKFKDKLYSEKLACSECGISIKDLEPSLFSFNSPEGACPNCSGLGSILKIDVNQIVAKTLTLSEGAIVPFARMLSHDTWWARLVKTVVEYHGFDYRNTQFNKFSDEMKKILLYGGKKEYKVIGKNRQGKTTVIHKQWEGFVNNLERRFEETDSEYMRKEINRFMIKKTCPVCQGNRLKKQALSVQIDKHNIAQISNLTIDKALKWSKQLNKKNKLNKKEQAISKPILKEITQRLKFLSSVGLNYLTLSREAATLAGGEAQRIRLASQIGTGLTGVLYILDEPTIGLHQRDNHRLIETLKNLRDKGNSVIVVEHDRDLIASSDQIIDFGPKAGIKGGQIVAQGSPEQIIKNKNSLTGRYLARKKKIRRKNKKKNKLLSDKIKNKPKIQIKGATQHNLKNINVDFPLNTLTCITGISGSGKSTLLNDTLYYHLAQKLDLKVDEMPGPIKSIHVPPDVKRLIYIDQSPIGKTPRSNPATYTKVFDYIRKIFAHTKEARIRGYNVGRFSFNVKGGRCEVCKGDGQIKIEMQFLPDVYVECDVCHGKRYNNETLQVKYKNKTISDVLDMTIDEAYNFFTNHSTLRHKLKTMIDVGLGYIKLGQSAPTLSGGEAQRVKLARELSKRSYDHVVYLLDEPTTGLHFHDCQKLLDVLHALVAKENTVIVIEHNLDIIKNADWIIDLGPEGGEKGGQVIATGSPKTIIENKKSFTGQFLAQELKEMK